MLWYEGSIAEAIQLSKAKKCIFLVYIFGEDELSKKMEETWNDESVSAIGQNCVAVKIESPSDMCTHFSQIYPVLVVPSTFFIDLNGVPIEVIAGDLSPEDFKKKVEEVLKQHESKALNSQPMTGASGAACPANPGVSQADPAPPTSSQETESKEPEIIQDEGPKAVAELEPSIASTSEMDLASAPSTSTVDDPTPAAAAASSGGADSSEIGTELDDKVQKVTQKMEESRVQRAQKEEEDSKSREIERRRLGKETQKFRRHKDEKSFKDIQEELKKQKEEDRQARQRVKDEIKRDKQERKEKYEREKAERDRILQETRERKQKTQEMSAAEREAARREISRLQFRLPDGSSVTNQFKSSEPLSAANSYVSQHLGCSSVQLYTVFPKRTFTNEDMPSSLLSLGLVPSAVLLVLPQKNAIARTADTSSSILNMIFAPFFMLWNLVYGLIFGRRPPAGSADNSGESKKRPREEADGSGPSTSNRPSTAYKRRSPISRQEGNIHKFTNNQDDDDDQSTWNGNSTQQM